MCLNESLKNQQLVLFNLFFVRHLNLQKGALMRKKKKHYKINLSEIDFCYNIFQKYMNQPTFFKTKGEVDFLFGDT